MSCSYRHLPHWIPEERSIFVTWRLAGSLPRAVAADTLVQHDARQDAAQVGPFWLQDARIAALVAEALVHGERVRALYKLHAWVIMPNHVHVILEPRVEMSAIMRWLKGRTARKANRILGLTGTAFWQEESFDHWIRTEEEFWFLTEYVEANPVKASFVDSAEDWPWSSACREKLKLE